MLRVDDFKSLEKKHTLKELEGFWGRGEEVS